MITVKFVKAGVQVYAFATPTPFVIPEHTCEFNDGFPPRLTSITKKWTIEGALFGKEDTVQSQYAALVAIVETPTNYPDGMQLIQGAGVAQDFSATAGWNYFKIERLVARKTPPIWRDELRFTITVTAKKYLSMALGIGDIGDLKLSETWSYSENGLSRITLEGELATISGSAVSAARALAPTLLPLPGANFGYTTAGPEGTDVVQLDQADKKARFTTTIRESGVALPAGVGPSFSQTVTTKITDGETTTTTTVSAVGPGAEAAVRSARPGGTTIEEVSVEPTGRGARATYVVRKADTHLIRIHEFSVRGGGTGLAFTRVSGGRDPAKHKLDRGPVEITETIRVEVTGSPSMDDFKMPDPVDGLDEDGEARQVTGPYRVEIGRETAGDKWAMSVRRVYRDARVSDLPTLIGEAVFRPVLNISAGEELARQIKLGGLTGTPGPRGLF